MKKIVIIIIVLIFGVTTIFAQTQRTKALEQEQSNAEKFSAKAGTLMQQEFLRIGKIKGAEISVVYYTDLINSTKDDAVKFEYEYSNSYTTSTKTAILDADEIDGLIKSIKLIQERIFPTTPANYTEVSFRSRGGFEAGCFLNKGQWDTFLKLDKFDSDSYVFLSQEDFPTLLDLLEQAKAKLQ